MIKNLNEVPSSYQKSTNKLIEKIFSAKDVYKMLSKVHSEMIQVREEIVEVKECIQKLSSNGTIMASNDLEPTALLSSTTYTSFEPDLPFHTDVQLKNVENKLNKLAYLSSVVNDIIRLGGTDYEDVINNALAYVISNQLACKFSWQGKGVKSSFRDFKLFNKALLILARFTKPDLTNKLFGDIVVKWFVQAPQRTKREEAKKEKARLLLQNENSSAVNNADGFMLEQPDQAAEIQPLDNF